MRSIFQEFSRQLLRDLQRDHPFVRPLDRALAPAVPKSSTYHLGISPRYDKNVFVSLHHSPKPWEAGLFTIDVIVSSKYEVPDEVDDEQEAFASFEDGCYRLGTASGGMDVWWCLLPAPDGKHWEAGPFRELWVPTSFGDKEAVVAQCSAEVRRFLLHRLFVPGGFVNAAV